MHGEFLEGVHVVDCAAFESWLIVERFRVAASIEARLRQAALDELAGGQPSAAVDFAAQLVSRNRFEEGHHELLVRCLAATGDEAGAARQVALAEDVLYRELGVVPSQALRAASVRATVRQPASVGRRAEAQSLLEAGRVALKAGAADAGIDCLRRAIDKSSDDLDLHGPTLLALGSALVHSVRGCDGEGSAVLHEAVVAATTTNDRPTLATTLRELGFVEVQAGRRSTATDWLMRAESYAIDDESLSAVLGVRGMNASDRADYPEAIEVLHRSIDAAARCGDQRQEAWSQSMLGRVHLLRNERSQAAAALQRSLTLVDDERWLAFQPWPLALRAELELRDATRDVDVDRIEQSWSLSCQLGDPCWEAMTARVLAMASARNGNLAAASTWLDEALHRCQSVTDQYQWVRAVVLDSMIKLAIVRNDHERASHLVNTLASLSARCEMRELVVRSHLHRARLGETTSWGSARLLADDIDNPALQRELHDFQRSATP